LLGATPRGPHRLLGARLAAHIGRRHPQTGTSSNIQPEYTIPVWWRCVTIGGSHSPALLNALDGNDHPGVVVIGRDRRTGRSRATRLVDLPGYYAMMASGGLGDAVAAGRSLDPEHPSRIDTGELDRLLGIA
jgi:hypothetical protein